MANSAGLVLTRQRPGLREWVLLAVRMWWEGWVRHATAVRDAGNK